MIQIVRGSQSQLFSYFSELSKKRDRTLWLYCPPDAFRTWNGIRVLLGELTSRLGQERVEAVVAGRRAAASFVLHELIEELTPEECAERRSLAARLDSHLTHNWYLQRPIFEAWAELLLELLSDHGYTLLVPVLNHVDQPSIAVMKSIYRVFSDRAPDLVLGYDSQATSPELDEQGLYWHHEPLDIQKLAFGLQMFSGVDVLDLSGDAVASQEILPTESRDLLGKDLESRALAALEDSADPPGPAVCSLVVAAVRASFESFGFRSALHLGLALLRRQPRLDPDQAAEIHGIIGLSAHNRQFQSSENTRLTNLLQHHFEQALRFERRPAVRCALLYRLAVTFGRRKKQLDEGLRWADEAISEARQEGLSPLAAAYCEVWGRNIRAYVLMLSKRIDEAFVDGEEGLSIIDERGPALQDLDEVRRERWEREFLISQAVLISNLASLSSLARTPDRFEHWRRRGGELAISNPALARFRAYDWIDLYRQTHRLELALPWARKGAEASHQDQEALWEYHYIMQAADLSYRLGDAAGAHGYYEELKGIWAQLGNPVTVTSVQLISTTAALRTDHLETAERSLLAGLSDPENDLPDARAEILALIGRLAARRGDREEAETRINEAIELAASSGERDTLLRVASTAGLSCRLLGRTEEARDAYERAVAIAEAETPPPPAADHLEAILGLQECGGPDLTLGLRALGLLPEALESGETWWNLTRLLSVLASITRSAPEALESLELTDPLQTLVTAAGQRPDCVKPLEELMTSLPPAQRERVWERALANTAHV